MRNRRNLSRRSASTKAIPRANASRPAYTASATLQPIVAVPNIAQGISSSIRQEFEQEQTERTETTLRDQTDIAVCLCTGVRVFECFRRDSRKDAKESV